MLGTQMIWPFCYCIGFASSLNPIFGALVLARNSLVFAWAWTMARGAPAEGAAETSPSSPRQSASVAAAKSTVTSSR